MAVTTNKIFNEDCLLTINRLQDKSVNLVVTSPPYEDVMSYGKSVSNKTSNDYIDWLCMIFGNLYDKVTDDGSVIINLGTKCDKGFRSDAVFRFIASIQNTGWKLYDVYIWSKPICLPNGSNRRLNQSHEYIIHLSKTPKIKANVDEVRMPYSENTDKRYKYKVFKARNKVIDENGLRLCQTPSRIFSDKKIGKIPSSVLKFSTAGALKDKPQNQHPAAFHPDLPTFFIKWLTERNDVVYDCFMGSGTTALASKQLGRNYIGSEINKTYMKLIDETLKSNSLEEIISY